MNSRDSIDSCWPSRLIAFVTFSLLAIWPLPGTMALRNLLFVVGLFSCFYFFQRLSKEEIRSVLLAQAPLLLFFLWIVVHLIFFSHEPQLQQRELRSFWLRPFLAGFLGVAFAMMVQHPERYRLTHRFLVTAFLLSLNGTLIIYTIRYWYEAATSNQGLPFDFFMIPYKGKPQLIIFITLGITAIYVYSLSKIQDTGKLRPLLFASISAAVAFFSFYTANTKNGFLILTIITFSIFSIFLFRAQERRWSAVIAIVFAASATLLIHKHIQHNQAWLSMLADVRVGIDIENQSYWRNWVDAPSPQNSSGETVNASTYLRTAWAVAGLDLIQENPIGYGLMNSSFSHLAKEKWSDFYTDNGQHMVDTHSSWIDLTLALGIPAIGLLLYSLAKSFIDAIRFKTIWSSYVIWLIPTLVLGYTIVEVTFDVFYELLIFLAATFAMLTRLAVLSREPGVPR